MIWPFSKKPAVAEPWHRSDSFERQRKFEGEGALAFSEHKTKEENPYGQHSMEWNMWLSGWYTAEGRYKGPMVDAKTGHQIICSTSTIFAETLKPAAWPTEIISQREWLERQAKKENP